MRVFIGYKSQAGFTPILIVLVLALVAAGGYFVYTKYSQNPNLSQVIPNNIVQKKVFLNLESPNSSTVAKDGVVEIKGKTLPNVTVVLMNNEDEKMIESDSYGAFQSNMVLKEGENNISVSAFTDDGQEKSVDVSVSYSSK